MKKLLNISVIAALAVLPVAANAARTVTAQDNVTAGAEANAMATASYVQGAYNAANSQINALISDTAVAEKQEGVYAAIHAGDKVSENLIALDNAVAGLTGNGENSVENKIKTEAEDADYTNTTSGLTADTIGEAIDEVEGRVDTLETKMGSTSLSGVTGLTATTATGAIVELQNDKQEKSDSQVTNAGNYLTTGYGVGANLQALDTAVGKVGTGTHNTGIAAGNSVAANIEALDTAIGSINSASGALSQNGNYITTTNTVAQNLGALDTQVKANEDDIDTIYNKQIPIVSNWSTNAVTNTRISQLTDYVAPAQPTVNCDDLANAENPACL